MLADIIIEKLTPIRQDVLQLIKEPAYLEEILKEGTERATELATNCWAEITDKVFGKCTVGDKSNVKSTAKFG